MCPADEAASLPAIKPEKEETEEEEEEADFEVNPGPVLPQRGSAAKGKSHKRAAPPYIPGGPKPKK